MNKVLVLGGTYFVGRKIVEILLSKKYEVTVLNRGTRPLPYEEVHCLKCERNDKLQMKEVLRNLVFDYIIDVSWQDMSWVQNTCDAIDTSHLKQFVFISSSSVYDVEHLNIPFKEEDPLGENKYWTFYGKGKMDAEKYYQEFFQNKEANLIILRPPYIYGEYNYAQRESLLFRQISEDQPVVIPSSNPKLQFLYTEDLALQIDYLLQNNTKKTLILNNGNRKAVSSSEWVEACAKVVGKEAKIITCDYEKLGKNVRDFYPFFDYDNVLDVEKINEIYALETPFEEGLRHAYEWFKANRDQIVFKRNVDQTLYEMIASLSI